MGDGHPPASRPTQSGCSFGGKVIACSDSSGYVLEENGIDLGLLKKIKNVRRQRISEYARCTEARLASIMCGIHDTCFQTAEEYGAPGNCVLGANIAGIVRVAESMRMLGVI